jgi:ectoine hydroxylase-related dioxygenase (phytanoyl-CoA dioxygenase family)
LDGHPACSPPCNEEDTRFETLVLDGPWSSLVKGHLGPTASLLLAERHYGRRTRHQNLHRDICALNLQKGYAINVVIALKPTSVSAGVTQVYLNSHRKDFKVVTKDIHFGDIPSENDQIIDLHAPEAGDWYTFNSEAIHRGTRNDTSENRAILILAFSTPETMKLPFASTENYRSDWNYRCQAHNTTVHCQIKHATRRQRSKRRDSGNNPEYTQGKGFFFK